MSFHPIHPKEVVSAIYHHLGKVKLTVEGNLHQGVYRVVFEALATVREIFERNLNNPDLASKEFRPIVDPREQERLMMPVHQLFLELNDKS